MRAIRFLTLMLISLGIIFSCTNTLQEKEANLADSIPLFKVVISYPNTDSTRFDMAYYEKIICPLWLGF